MKRILAPWADFSSPAMARAGMMWPPVPPPAMATRTGLIHLAGDVQQHADGREHDEQRGSSVGDEGQGDAFGGDEGEHNADVEEGLDEQGRGDAESQEAGERVFRQDGGTHAAITKHDEESDDGDGSDEAEFFGDVGENVIGMRLRQIEELLAAVHIAQAAKAAGSDGDEGLNDVEALAERI